MRFGEVCMVFLWYKIDYLCYLNSIQGQNILTKMRKDDHDHKYLAIALLASVQL